MRRIVLVCVYFLGVAILGAPVLAQAKSGLTPPILMYHSVFDIPENFSLSDHEQMLITRLAQLEAELKYLNQHKYTTIFMSDFANRQKKHWGFVTSTVALTFDDGTDDTYTDVLPLIKKYHTKITVFVNPGFNGKGGRLSFDQIRALHDSGLVEIGAHTMTHPHLLTLSDEEARLEIVNSKLLLESIIGAPVTSFAYPFGESSPAIQSFVAYGGFNVAVDADDRYGNNYGNIFQIPRTGICGKTSMTGFIRAIHGW